jgi:hypothetical protein
VAFAGFRRATSAEVDLRLAEQAGLAGRHGWIERNRDPTQQIGPPCRKPLASGLCSAAYLNLKVARTRTELLVWLE